MSAEKKIHAIMSIANHFCMHNKCYMKFIRKYRFLLIIYTKMISNQHDCMNFFFQPTCHVKKIHAIMKIEHENRIYDKYYMKFHMKILIFTYYTYETD